MEKDAAGRNKIGSRETDRVHTSDPKSIFECSSFSDPTDEDDKAFPPDYSHGEDDHVAGGKTKMDRALSFQNMAQPEVPYKPFEYHLSSISPKEIHLSIVSSENTRVVCSFVIAALVVLSHINLPHNVVESNSLIVYRPLYALLLTDTLIVAARLALYSETKVDDNETKFENGVVGSNSWDGAVKLLEWGLVLHQTIRAAFIDCSFYVAIVVCGLSMV